VAKRKVGRPKVEIDREQAKKLFKLWCTKCEMAGYFGISEKSLERICHKWAEEIWGEGDFDALRKTLWSRYKVIT
jgi:hypothetical protein